MKLLGVILIVIVTYLTDIEQRLSDTLAAFTDSRSPLHGH